MRNHCNLKFPHNLAITLPCCSIHFQIPPGAPEQIAAAATSAWPEVVRLTSEVEQVRAELVGAKESNAALTAEKDNLSKRLAAAEADSASF